MNARIPILPALVLSIFVAAGVGVRAADKDIAKLEPEVQSALAEFTKTDSGLQTLLSSAEGYAVFPKAGKGGFVVGGAHGRGLVYERGVLIGSAKMSQVTVGAQIGGQAFAELILFENKESLNRFKESRFEMGAQLSAVAAAEGKAKDAKYHEGVLVFTRPLKGLMAEASVGGQKFRFNPLDK